MCLGQQVFDIRNALSLRCDFEKEFEDYMKSEQANQIKIKQISKLKRLQITHTRNSVVLNKTSDNKINFNKT
jgi:hypothetical protein